MAVIINEFEVIADNTRAANDAAAAPSVQPQPAPPLTPDVVLAIWQREMERAARVAAG